MCICRCVYKSKHNLLGWPESSFQFFHKKLQENMNRFFFFLPIQNIKLEEMQLLI